MAEETPIIFPVPSVAASVVVSAIMPETFLVGVVLSFFGEEFFCTVFVSVLIFSLSVIIPVTE